MKNTEINEYIPIKVNNVYRCPKCGDKMSYINTYMISGFAPISYINVYECDKCRHRYKELINLNK